MTNYSAFLQKCATHWPTCIWIQKSDGKQKNTYMTYEHWHSAITFSFKQQNTTERYFLLGKNSKQFISTGMGNFCKTEKVMLSSHEILRKHRVKKLSEEQNNISK